MKSMGVKVSAKSTGVRVAERFNTGKPMLSYFRRSFSWALEAVARVKEFGANKYGDDNWRHGGKPDAEYLDSMDRHLNAFLNGEAYDQDSGCHHIGHAIWNLCALMELNHKNMPATDDPIFRRQMDHWAKKRQEKENDSKSE